MLSRVYRTSAINFAVNYKNSDNLLSTIRKLQRYVLLLKKYKENREQEKRRHENNPSWTSNAISEFTQNQS